MEAWQDRVAVALLNWNGRQLLERFLPSVVRYSPAGSVYVIDNASTDDSRSFLEAEYPEVHVVALDENYGFSGGYNLGIEQIDREYIVLLNTDVEVTRNWLEPVLTYLDKHPKVAVAMPKLKDLKAPNHFEYAGAAGGYLDHYGYPFCRGRVFDVCEKDEGQYEEPCAISWASGAAFFVRREVFLEQDGLDEDYFAHMEEIDLCWRIRNSGYEVHYVPYSEVYHLGGATLNKVSPRKTFLNFRNSLVTYYKNTSPQTFKKRILMRLVLDGLGALMFLFKFKFSHFAAVLQAHMDFYFRFAYWKSQRAHADKSVQAYTDGSMAPFSVALKFYLQNKQRYPDLMSKPKKH